MNVNRANGLQSPGTDRTASDADGRSCMNPPTARIKIPADRLPAAPEPTLPYREQEKLGIGAWIDHDYRVRMAMKKRNDRRDAGKS